MGVLSDFADQLAGVHGGFIQSAGSDVVVRDVYGNTRTATALVQPIRPEEITDLSPNGFYNVRAGRPTLFCFQGDDPIAEVGNVIIWDGWEWEVKDMPKTPGGSLFLNKSVLCTRKKPYAGT